MDKNEELAYTKGRKDQGEINANLIEEIRTLVYQEGYSKGRADAIDEFVKELEKCVAMQWVDIQDIWKIQEKLKEQKNG